MFLGNLEANGQSQAGSAISLVGLKHGEDAAKIIRSNAHSIIPHLDSRILLGLAEHDFDVAIDFFSASVNRITDQVH